MTVLFSVLALPIFPVRLQTSIFGASELNFRVRNGNGWTLTAINTNLLSCEQETVVTTLVRKKEDAFAPSKPNKVTFVPFSKRLHSSSLLT